MTVPSFPIVDSHAHVWTNDPAFPWSPDAAATPTYDATPNALLKDMERTSIDTTVLVQYIGYRWDNSYVARAVAAAPERFAGVCRVNPEDPAAPEQLSYWTKDRGLHGVRISPEPGSRGDWFRGPLMDPFFRRAAELRIPVVLLAKTERIPELCDILERHPDVDVVIDHFADADLKKPEHMRWLVKLADNPRVFLKTGHIWANSKQAYPWPDQLALVRELRGLFGASRIMWGSDWPLCREHTTYDQALSYIQSGESLLTHEELAWILGGTARRLWKMPKREVLPTARSSEIVEPATSASPDYRDA